MKDEKEINVSEIRAINIAIAKSLNKMREVIDNYFEDANTRPEMLASLTEEEIRKFVDELYKTYRKGHNTIKQWSLVEFTLFLDQPTFARLFCTVKGLL